MADKKWMQKAFPKKTKGALHRMMGIPEGEKIPWDKMVAAAKKGGMMGKRAQAAMNAMKANR